MHNIMISKQRILIIIALIVVLIFVPVVSYAADSGDMAYTAPAISDFESVVTALDMIPASLTANIDSNSETITSVVFKLLDDDYEYPEGAHASVVDTTTYDLKPTAQFSVDIPGIYKVKLEVGDGISVVSKIAEIMVYSSSCEIGREQGGEINYFDLDHNCIVDVLDLAIFAEHWLDNTGMQEAEQYTSGVNCTIQAEMYTIDSDGETPDIASGIMASDGFVEGIEDDSWLKYSSIDFGDGANKIALRFSSLEKTGKIDIRLDSIDGELISTINTAVTGSWDQFNVTRADFLRNVSGVKDIYIVVTDNGMKIDWFELGFEQTGHKIQAVEYDIDSEGDTPEVANGIRMNDNENRLSWTYGGAWVKYSNIDFGSGSTSVRVLASSIIGGQIEFRLDSPTGPSLATIDVPVTASWDDPVVIDSDIIRALNVHDLYLYYNYGKADVYSFTFAKPSNVTLLHEADETTTLVSSNYLNLDMDGQLKLFGDDPDTYAPVPLGPCLVVGEGAHADNHTVIRILNEYQIPEVQFLAYPPAVTGGVGVNTGKLDGEVCIVAHSLAGTTREIRVFDRYGGMYDSFIPDESVIEPYCIAVGDFLSAHNGDEIAVTMANVDNQQQYLQLHLYSIDGTRLKRLQVGRAGLSSGRINIFGNEYAGGNNHIVLYDVSQKYVTILDANLGSENQLNGPALLEQSLITDLPDGINLFGSQYSDRDYNAGGYEYPTSTLYKISNYLSSTVDAGYEENIFWVAYPEYADVVNDPEKQELEDFLNSGRYVKRSYCYFAPDSANVSEVLNNDDPKGYTFSEWTSGATKNYMQARINDQYARWNPKIWGPAFLQRWGINKSTGLTKLIHAIEDGLPKYLLLDRNNQEIAAGYFDDITFYIGSMNFVQPVLNDYYTYGIRKGLQMLSKEFREAPQWLNSVEPNHECEVRSEENDGVSLGDYNPANIQGFKRYLLYLYGSLGAINARFGTPFNNDFFDAPRDQGRGIWDAYGNKGGFSEAWYAYNVQVVYRRVGASLREALLAGFPPEYITTHQIADIYSKNDGINGYDPEMSRITPIDWLLTTGTSFGCSRYGYWVEDEYNAPQGLHSSGFDRVDFWEYNPFTNKGEDAFDQLKFCMDNGIFQVGALDEFPATTPARQYSIEKLIAEYDVPRKGLAGGISEVRPYSSGGRGFDIAALGTDEKNTGLIKSIKPDGRVEGTVYCVPFHAHIEIEDLELNTGDNFTLESGDEKGLVNIAEPYHGMQVEFVFDAIASQDDSLLEFRIYNEGVLLDQQDVEVAVDTKTRSYRVIHKLTLPTGELTYRVRTAEGESIEVNNMHAYLHTEKNIRLRRAVMEGERHKGGVAFDILD